MSDDTDMYIYDKNNGREQPQNESEPTSLSFLLLIKPRN